VVDGVSHAFTTQEGEGVHVLDDVSVQIPPGQFVAIVGESGCGKTTILNMMAGLIRPLSGTVKIDDDEILRPTRHTSFMFARDALLPWRTARKNVELAIEVHGGRGSERRAAAQRALELVGLEDFGSAYPHALSQGMRQRVAVARTLVTDPDTLLMDEPFAALDAQTRVRVQAEFIKIWERYGQTVVFVTHDLSEAVLLADRVIIMSSRPGRVVDDIAINLPRPRDVEEVRFSEDYRELYERVWHGLKKVETNE
jgi:NitT/TauT family transport system ATP-binding protein